MISNLARGVTAFTSNVFLVGGDRPALVDVGASFDVVSTVTDRIDDLDVVVLTHTHPDHVGNLGAVTAAFDVPVLGFDTSKEGVTDGLADGETVRLGNDEFLAMHTPGHAPDHLCLYAPESGILFAGDLVFANGGFGRTDLPGADRETLIGSIDRVREEVEGNLEELHTGHGPSVINEPADHVALAARMARQV